MRSSLVLRRVSGDFLSKVGYPSKKKSAVPDRLKEAFNYYGVNDNVADPPKGPPILPPEHKRSEMLGRLTGSGNAISITKRDTAQRTISRLKNTPSDRVEEWSVLYTLFEKHPLMTELVRESYDPRKPGEVTWIELNNCKVPRLPLLYKTESGIICMPAFTVDHHMMHFFQTMDLWEGTWSPIPKGSRIGRQEFLSKEFPVCSFGDVAKVCALATIAVDRPVVIIVNPKSKDTKFLSYKEMLGFSRRRQRAQERKKNMAEGTQAPLTAESSGSDLGSQLTVDHAYQLHTLFDTTRWSFERLNPAEMKPDDFKSERSKRFDAKDESLPCPPPIAQDELLLLMFQYQSIGKIYASRVPVPRNLWQRAFGNGGRDDEDMSEDGRERLAQQPMELLVVLKDAAILKAEKKFNNAAEIEDDLSKALEALKVWSYFTEIGGGGVRVLETEEEARPEKSTTVLLYSFEDGAALRKWYHTPVIPLAERLRYGAVMNTATK